MEKWRDVLGYEGLYQVSDEGRVRSLTRVNNYGRKVRGQIMKQHKSKHGGYLTVGLCKNGKRTLFYVHRLVAWAFIEPTDTTETVNHINEIKTDNRVENLEWMTLHDNTLYGTHMQRMAESMKGKVAGPAHPNYGRRGSQALTHKGTVIGVSMTDSSEVRFDTAATAARALHLSTGRLCDAINGKAKSCGGYYWRRVNG